MHNLVSIEVEKNMTAVIGVLKVTAEGVMDAMFLCVSAFGDLQQRPSQTGPASPESPSLNLCV
jgi:hypothetical protein